MPHVYLFFNIKNIWQVERGNLWLMDHSKLCKFTKCPSWLRGIRAPSTSLSPQSGSSLDPDCWVPILVPCLQLGPFSGWYCAESSADGRACAELLQAAGILQERVAHASRSHLREQILDLMPALFLYPVQCRRSWAVFRMTNMLWLGETEIFFYRFFTKVSFILFSLMLFSSTLLF